MSKENNLFKGFMPMFNGESCPMSSMSFASFGNLFGKKEDQDSCKEEDNTKKENFKSTAKSIWTQSIDMQKSFAENKKKVWNQFYDYMIEAQETITSSLPEDTSSLPKFITMSPKDFMKKVKEFEDMANEHFMKQADSFGDFFIQGQEKIYDMVSSAMEKKEAENSEASEEA